MAENVSRSAMRKLDAHLAKFIVSSGCSFLIVTNPHSANLIHRLRRMYSIPSTYQLSGPLLEKPFDETKATVDAVIGTAATHAQAVIYFDSCESINREHVMNILVKVDANKFFIDSLATATERVKEEFMANHLITAVDNLSSPDCVCGVVSDNASSCVKAKHLVAEYFPGLMPSQNVLHAADLLEKDLGAAPTIARVIAFSQDIRMESISISTL